MLDLRIRNPGFKERWMSGFFTVCKDVRSSDINYWGSRKKSEKGVFYNYKTKGYFLKMSYWLESRGYKKRRGYKNLVRSGRIYRKEKKSCFWGKDSIRLVLTITPQVLFRIDFLQNIRIDVIFLDKEDNIIDLNSNIVKNLSPGESGEFIVSSPYINKIHRWLFQVICI